VREKLLAAAGAFAVLAVAGCGGPAASGQDSPVANVSMHDADGLNGVVLPRAYRAAHVDLRDTAGRPFDLATDPSKPLTLVFFGYTNCPDVCQVVMANIAAAMVRLRPAERAKVAMLFVTTDPHRDTPSVLRSYLDRFSSSFEGATGSLPAVVKAGRAFDIPVAKGHRLASGGYDVAHGTNVVGLRPDGRAPYVWTQGTTPAALSADVRAILDGEAGR
jgi:protein SCO1/2